MTKNNTIGRLTCPICGEPLQDLRYDKNNKLYMYCDNLCSIKFNGKMSKKYLPLLMQGQNVQIEKIGLITSIMENKTNERLQWKQPRVNTGADRAATDGRSDRPIDGVRADNKPTGGFWRGLLADDDE